LACPARLFPAYLPKHVKRELLRFAFTNLYDITRIWKSS
jgi:hypothetical protein